MVIGLRQSGTLIEGIIANTFQGGGEGDGFERLTEIKQLWRIMFSG